MYDVITFGSAAQDIFIKSKKFLPVLGKNFATGEGICLSLGSKIEMDDVFFYSGGGGTNTAATFAKQGLKVAYCGQVGDDFLGGAIAEELKNLGIGADFVEKTKEKPTNISVILTYPGKDRTVMVYRGASDVFWKNNIPWGKIKNTKWFYLAPFSGKLAGATEDLVNFAVKNKIKVAFNPGYAQLTMPKATLRRILRQINVLILNREEASRLTGAAHQGEKQIFQRIDKMARGIAIMTKGGEGAVVSDGKHIFRAKSLGLKMVDVTGAGDAFGAGFVTGLIKKNNIEYAIQLAMANSGYSITRWGAKEGLLNKNQEFRKVKVSKEKCSEDGLCQLKP